MTNSSNGQLGIQSTHRRQHCIFIITPTSTIQAEH